MGSKLRVPKSFIYVDKDYSTRYLQNKKNGRMMGRKHVKGRGDGTAVRRVKKGKHGGQILGRTSPIPVKGTNKSRGHIRRTLD